MAFMIILRTTTPLLKREYRRIEKQKLRIVKLKSHLSFNETCIINNMLQTYTNVKLQDDAAREETFVLDFRKKMVEGQIEEEKEEIVKEESDSNQQLEDFRDLLQSDLRYKAFIKLFIKNKCKASQSTASRHHVVYPYSCNPGGCNPLLI